MRKLSKKAAAADGLHIEKRTVDSVAREIERFDAIQARAAEKARTGKATTPLGSFDTDLRTRSKFVLQQALIDNGSHGRPMKMSVLAKKAGVPYGRVRTWLSKGITSNYQPRKRRTKSKVQGRISLREQVDNQKTDLEKVCDVLGITTAQLWDKEDVLVAAMSLLHVMRPMMDASEQSRLIKFVRSISNDVLKRFGLAAT